MRNPRLRVRRPLEREFIRKMEAQEKGLVSATVRIWTKPENQEACLKAMRKAGKEFEVKLGALPFPV